MNAADAFRDAIAAAGLHPPKAIIPDGKLHRFASDGDTRGDDAGWYVAHLDGVPAGAFGCWRRGLARTWCARERRELSPAERAEHARRIRVAREAQRHDLELRRAECRKRAATILSRLPEATADHPYLARKQVQPHGARQDGDRLVIPVADAAGTLHGLQFISPDGGKLFLTGTAKRGCFHMIGEPGGELVIAEGFATAASIREATGHAVAVAFDAGNLLPVAETLRQRHPEARNIIAGDNDVSGTGQAKAKAAAAAVGGVAIIPPGTGDDWNDVAVRSGLAAVAAAFAEAPAEPEPLDDAAELARLAALPPIEYDRARVEAAKRLSIRPGTLDDERKRLRGEAGPPNGKGGGTAVELPTPEPWPEPVNGAELLDELAATFARHLVLPAGAAEALALWTEHSHAHDSAAISAILAVTSPTKECGKTTLLTVLGALVARPLPASNITAAAMFRAVEKWRPTLLVDEADTFLRDSDELRGVLNSGHGRANAFVIRTTGEDHEPRRFATWAPKAIALIGKLHPTLDSRSIHIELRRMAPGERVAPVRADRLHHLEALARKAVRWAVDNEAALRRADPAMPPGFTGRRADNWRHLFAIADAAGGDWPTRARQAAELLSAGDDAETAGVLLLADIRDLFSERGTDRLSSGELAKALGEMLHRPWPEWGKAGKPISERAVAKLLEPFKVKPNSVRIGTGTPKGYMRDWIKDAFGCYLPTLSATPQQSSKSNGLAAAESATKSNGVADAMAPEPAENNDCCGVADAQPEIWSAEL